MEMLFLNSRSYSHGYAIKTTHQWNGISNMNTKVALVGIGLKLPGKCTSTQDFWSILMTGVNTIRDIPEDRFCSQRFYCNRTNVRGKLPTIKMGSVDNFEYFDNSYFDISEHEAFQMDPQQRFLLDTTAKALEDACITKRSIRGQPVSVFVGISTHDFSEIHQPIKAVDIYGPTGSAQSISANRISYHYDLVGPSMIVDTACSSGLTAFHMGTESILDGSCHTSIIGNVNFIINPLLFSGFGAASMLSPDGACKAFDASGNGFVRSEGAVTVVIKRLDHAIRDQNKIYAIVEATGTNHNGSTNGITLPNSENQYKLLKHVYGTRHLDVGNLVYVEAHGTGTKVGDPAEFRALKRAFCLDPKRENPLHVGSAKTNFGHLEAAAGLVGLAKAAMVLHKREIPPNLHFKTPNPELGYEDGHIVIPVDPITLPTCNGTPMAGINSFGFGGSNAHAVLSAYENNRPTITQVGTEDSCSHPIGLPFLLSGHSKESYEANKSALLGFIQDRPGLSLEGLSRSLLEDRDHHKFRSCVFANTAADLVAQLEDNEKPTLINHPSNIPEAVIVFSGQGTQWWAMARDLMQIGAQFRDHMMRCDLAFSQYFNFSIIEELAKNEDESAISHTNIAQPCLFAIQTGIFRLLQEIGVKIGAVVGHSVGEVVAAYCSGALSFSDSIKVVVSRSTHQEKAYQKGGMLVVNCSLNDFNMHSSVLSEYQYDIAAINSPNSIVIAGAIKDLKRIKRYFTLKEYHTQYLRVEYPFHSHILDPFETDIRNDLCEVHSSSPQLPLWSTVTGQLVNTGDMSNEYWWKNSRQPVQFERAITSILEHGFTHFIEVGPSPALIGHIEQTALALKKTVSTCYTLSRKQSDQVSMQQLIRNLYLQNHTVRWHSEWFGDTDKLSLPEYKLNPKPFWFESNETRLYRLGAQISPLITFENSAPGLSVTSIIGLDILPYLGDHRIQDEVIFPAAGLIEIMLSLAAKRSDNLAVSIVDFTIHSPILVNTDINVLNRLTSTIDDCGSLTIHANQLRVNTNEPSSNSWELKASSKLEQRNPDLEFECLPLDTTQACYSPYSLSRVAQIYAFIEDIYCIHYGPQFRNVVEAYYNTKETLIRVQAHAINDIELIDQYSIHPALLDCAFHAIFFSLNSTGELPELRLPYSAKRIRYVEKPGTDFWCRCQVRKHTANMTEVDLVIYTASGNPCAALDGFQLIPAKSVKGDVLNHLYAYSISEEEHPIFKQASILDELKSVPYQDQDQPSQQQLKSVLPSSSNVTCGHGSRGAVGETFIKLLFEMKILHAPCGANELPAVSNVVVDDLRPWAESLIARYWTSSDLHVSQSTTHQVVLSRLKHLSRVIHALINDNNLIKLLTGRRTIEEILEMNFNQCLEYFQLGQQLRASSEKIGKIVANMISASSSSLNILELGDGFTELGVTIANHLTNCQHGDGNHRLFVATRGSGASQSQLKCYLEKLNEKTCFKPLPIALDLHASDAHFSTQASSQDIILLEQVTTDTLTTQRQLQKVDCLLANGGYLVIHQADEYFTSLNLVLSLYADGRSMTQTASKEAAGDYLSFDDIATSLTNIGYDIQYQSGRITSAPDAPGGRILIAKKIAKNINSYVLETDFLLIDANQSSFYKHVTKGIDEKIPYLECTPDNIEFGRKHRQAIVYIAGRTDQPDKECLLSTASQFNRFIQMMLKRPEHKIEIFIVTENVHSIASSTDLYKPNILLSTIWGYCRVAQMELKDIYIKLIDLDLDSNPNCLLNEIVSNRNYDEVFYRNNYRYVQKLENIDLNYRGPYSYVQDTEITEYSIQKGTSNALLDYKWKQNIKQALGENELRVSIKAVGMNYRDILKQLGVYPDTDNSEVLLGDEFSGIVSEVGCGIKDFKVGEAVFGFARGCFASSVAVHHRQVFRLPESMDHFSAATVPVGGLTAYYSLGYLAKISAEDTVLVHSATGGVGLHAINYCRHVGANVIATVGTQEKRDYLSSLGIEHVFDSHSLDYVSDVLRVTKGRGVDVVLNTLGGDAIDLNLELLSDFGRYIELGKKDIYLNKRLGLSYLKRNISFHVVDLDRFFSLNEINSVSNDSPRRLEAVFIGFSKLVEQMVFEPIRHQVFSINELSDGLTLMSEGRHIGKIVVGMEVSSQRIQRIQSGLSVRDEVHVLIGGSGGIGLALIEHLVRKGAKSIFVMTRNQTKLQPHQTRTINNLQGQGTDIVLVDGDCSEYAHVEKILAQAHAINGSIAAVYHLAVLIDDAYVHEMTDEKLCNALLAKALGAWNLHKATLRYPTCKMILFSSFSSVRGNLGQANYSAANYVLDILSHYRMNMGMHCLTLNSAAISDAGIAERNEKLLAYLDSAGLQPISVVVFFYLMEHAIKNNLSNLAIVPLNNQAREAVRIDSINVGLRMEALFPQANEVNIGGSLRVHELLKMSFADCCNFVSRELRQKVIEMFNLEHDQVDLNASLSDIGMDSMAAAEILTWINGSFRVNLTILDVMDNMSIQPMARKITQKLKLN